MSVEGITRRLIAGLMVLIILSYTNPLALAAGPGGAVPESQELQAQLNRIKSFSASRDLAAFEAAVEEKIADWEKMGMENYGYLMLTVVQTLASESFEDRRQYKLMESYARRALKRAGQIPLEVELKLLQYTEADLDTPGGPQGEEWAAQRSADMQLWFQAWKRLNDSIDPHWNSTDLPQSKVAPPLAASLPAGVVPEAIQDPRLRAEYEAAVEANRQKAERYNQQYGARKLQRSFFPKAEQYIIAAYSHSPFNLEELQKYLMQYVEDELTRQRIIAATRRNMGLRSQ